MLSLLMYSVTYLKSADALCSSVALYEIAMIATQCLQDMVGKLHQIAERTKGGAGSML